MPIGARKVRLSIAFLGHAPALRLFYGERLPPKLVRANWVAIALTLMGMAGAGIAAGRSRRLGAALTAWALGHVLWGAYLAVRLGRQGEARNREDG